jgi:plastocyanin
MRIITISIFILCFALMIVGASGCQQAGQLNETKIISTQENAHAVEIKNFAFNPSEIAISKGDEVIWINKDTLVHTVSADDDSFSYKLIAGQYATRQFNATGEFAYHCAIHTSMKGKVIVR